MFGISPLSSVSYPGRGSTLTQYQGKGRDTPLLRPSFGGGLSPAAVNPLATQPLAGCWGFLSSAVLLVITLHPALGMCSAVPDVRKTLGSGTQPEHRQ